MEDLGLKGKRVLLTGHTGFKGAWLAVWLHHLGANVIGFAQDPLYDNSVYALTKIGKKITADLRGDIRNKETVRDIFKKYKPEVVFHLAAQALVLTSYKNPSETIETNVIGTLNVLECIRELGCEAGIMITSDKCYKNKEIEEGYKEEDEMGGKDPYSCSKACADLVAQMYLQAFEMKNVAITRAGNVIGGGDWAEHRLVADIMRSLRADSPIVIRNPQAVRPWQHVLEPLSGYLFLASELLKGKNMSGAWNFGPEREAMVTVYELAQQLVSVMGKGHITIQQDTTHKESTLLFLDISKAKNAGWRPHLKSHDAVAYTAEWYSRTQKEDAYSLCVEQIERYLKVNHD